MQMHEPCCWLHCSCKLVMRWLQISQIRQIIVDDDIAVSLPDRIGVWQAVEDDAEELSKWSRAMKRCQQHLADSARFAAWHNVNPLLSFTLGHPLACSAF